jgi:malate synthase
MDIRVVGPLKPRFEEILTEDALNFVGQLQAKFAGKRHDRLMHRMEVRNHVSNGRDLKFLPETENIRNDGSWKVAGFGPGLEDRRIEITGPTDPKMTANAMNSGANVWLADQEDATSPTWHNVITGQLSLYDAIRGQLDYTSPPQRTSHG